MPTHSCPHCHQQFGTTDISPNACPYCTQILNPAMKSPPTPVVSAGPQRVIIAKVDIGLGNYIVILFGIGIAAIPAGILLSPIFFVLYAIFSSLP